MDVTPRQLICRPLAALQNNRAEAEKFERELLAAAEKASRPNYRFGIYPTMDWLVSRLQEFGAAA